MEKRGSSEQGYSNESRSETGKINHQNWHKSKRQVDTLGGSLIPSGRRSKRQVETLGGSLIPSGAKRIWCDNNGCYFNYEDLRNDGIRMEEKEPVNKLPALTRILDNDKVRKYMFFPSKKRNMDRIEQPSRMEFHPLISRTPIRKLEEDYEETQIK
ncbi:unnamed protein product [Gordionus sp. m RMFG-2023]